MSAIVTEHRPTQDGGLREVVLLAWPLVLTNGCWTVQIFLDRVFLAQYSGRDMAATLPAVMFFWALQNFFFHTAGYVSTFVAQYVGAGRPHRVGPAIGQALHFALIGGAFFIVLAPFTGSIVQLFGHGDDLQAQEAIFLRCLCFGALPELIKATAFSFFNGRGESRTVLGISLVSLSVNAVLDYCWIFGRFGFPAWGIAGAGWATVVASTVAATLSMTLMLRRRYRKEFGINAIGRFELPLFRRLLRFGLPNGAFIAIETAAFSVFVIILGRFGESELAASNMAFTLNMIAFLPTLGIGQAVEILVGRHLGENRPDRAENRTWIGFALGWSLMAAVAAGYLLAPDLMLAPFVTAGNARDVTVARILLRFVAFYTLFDAANLTFSFALRGAGDTRFVMRMVSFLPWFGMVLPAILSYRFGWGVYWAWAIATAYVCILAVVFFARFQHGAWKTMRVIEPAFDG